NHDEAARAFRQAARLDPSLAMAHWGVALALGPNINAPVDAAQEKAAYEAVQKAVNLAAGAAEHERAYIEALAVRYSADPKADLKKLAIDYKEAMGRLARRYPDDLDAATLYAESMMDLRPWQLWSKDGKPAEAARCNAAAAAADEAYFQKARCSEGIYPMMYYSHNLHFLAVAHAMQGRYADAKAAADKLAEHVKQHVEEMPMLEGFLPMPVLVLARFKRWDDILNIPAPPAEQKLVAASRHFARGLALAATGRLEDAVSERKTLYSIKTALPEKAMYSP